MKDTILEVFNRHRVKRVINGEIKKVIMHYDFEEVAEHIEHVINKSESISDVSESALIEELRLKLIGMECFASEYYNEAAQKSTATIFQELERWIKVKRELHSH